MDFSAIKALIQQNIRTNNNEDITGNVLQQVLLGMIETLGDDAINDILENIDNIEDVIQDIIIPNTGQSEAVAMSQKITTDKFYEIETLLTDNALLIEQGGILWDGTETSDPEYARNRGFIKPPFNISVNSGYTILQINLYNDDGTVNQMITNLGSSYSYNGELRARVVLCKNPLAVINPDEYGAIVNTYQSASGGLIGDINELNNKVAQKVNLPFSFEQGGILWDGSEVITDYYIRTIGKIPSPFSIEVNSGYQIVQVVEYNSSGGVVSSTAVSTTEYEYNGIYKVRLVINKTNSEKISPYEDIIASSMSQNEALTKIAADEESVKNNLGVLLEQGGIYANGNEILSPNYVRTAGFLDSPFKIELASGYQIIQIVLYDKYGVPINEDIQPSSGTSYYEYDGGFKSRIVFSKNPNDNTIRPNQKIIKSIEFSDELRLDSIEKEIYGQSELLFEQGGILWDGTETDTPDYIRTIGYIIEYPFTLSVKSGYTIIQANLYDENDNVLQMLTDLGSEFSYDGTNKVRIVVCKQPLANITPDEDFINSYINERTKGLRPETDRLIKTIYGEIILEQGGLYYDGSESSDPNYVRNDGFILPPFNLSVNNGYTIIQVNLYNANGTVNQMLTYLGSSYSYSGNLRARVVFCKDPLAVINPDEYGDIIEFFEDQSGLEIRVETLEEKNPKILYAENFQNIPEVVNGFCFFKKELITFSGSSLHPDKKYQRAGLWSDGIVWRNIVDNNLFITGSAFKTIKISDNSVIVAMDDEKVGQIWSVTKLMNLVIVCDSGIDLNTKVTVSADDKSTGWWYSGFVDVGDEVTINDLMCSAVIISDNTACQTLARVVGYVLDPSAASDADARAAFIAAMNTKAQTLGMSDSIYRTAFGGGNGGTDSTPTDQCKLAKEIYTNQAYTQIQNKWGLLSYEMTITGTNARTYTINNEINAEIRANYLPGFVGGKPGQGNYDGTLLWVWLDDNNVAYASYVSECELYGGNCTYQDAKRVVDYSKENIV